MFACKLKTFSLMDFMLFPFFESNNEIERKKEKIDNALDKKLTIADQLRTKLDKVEAEILILLKVKRTLEQEE
jgi:hypothetical protein